MREETVGEFIASRVPNVGDETTWRGYHVQHVATFFTCAHCGQLNDDLPAMVGDQKLCHPNDGLDCYRLVTVYGHAMPCPHFVDGHDLDDHVRNASPWKGPTAR